MQVVLAEIHGKPVTLELKDGIVYLDGEAEPIKNLGEEQLVAFQREIDDLPRRDDPGYKALVNAVRAAFIAKILSGAVGDDCVDKLTRILDHVHYEVIQFLGDDSAADAKA